MNLTKSQRRWLEFLSLSPRPVSEYNLSGSVIAMFRRMEEKGLVGRNSHNMWFIRNEGRQAIEDNDR